MLSETQRRQNISFAENVALLYPLCRSPDVPHANPWPAGLVNQDSGRALSFKNEVSLAKTLAFLSGISDDPARVVAVCVEELSGSGIRVVVAVNKKNPRSGNDILMRIKNGLEGVFGQLSRVYNASNTDEDAALEDAVLATIASMCQQRIFSRIKSQRPGAKYTKTKTQFLGSVVQQALDVVHERSTREGPSPEVERFTKYARRLLRCLEALETCEGKDVLPHVKDILRAAHRFDKTAGLDALLQGIPPSQQHQAVHTSLGPRVRKLAMYRECALHLSEMAKKSGLFRKTEVTVVSLDSQLFTRDLTVPPDLSLTGCLSRYDDGTSRISGAGNMASQLNKLDISNRKFRNAVKDIINDSCVHAEVQIVCHYELHPVAKKPRVICSSKDACYLCNLLIQLHGTFYIPRTHGNFYHRWRLLPIPTLDRVQAQLNQALETKIKELIVNLMTANNPRRRLSVNDNESTVFPFPTRLPTPASSVLCLEPEPWHPSPPQQEAGPSPHPESEQKSSPEFRPALDQASEPDQASSRAPGLNPSPVKTDPPTAASTTQLLLTRGQPLVLRLHHNNNNNNTNTNTTGTTVDLPSLTAGPITILPSFTRTLASSSRSVIIQWLPWRQAAAISVSRPRRGFVDIELLREGVEIDIDNRSLEGVYLGYRGEVVAVELCPEQVRGELSPAIG